MVAGLTPQFVFNSFLSLCFALQFVYVLFVTQCCIQGHSHIYRVVDMFLALVIPYDIQHPS